MNIRIQIVTCDYDFEVWLTVMKSPKRESHKKRRRDSRLIYLYKGLKGKASFIMPMQNALAAYMNEKRSLLKSKQRYVFGLSDKEAKL